MNYYKKYIKYKIKYIKLKLKQSIVKNSALTHPAYW